jgi:hypothetical protein
MVVEGRSEGWFVFIFFGTCTLIPIAILWPATIDPKLDSSVEALLGRYPGPMLLRPSSRKWSLILLASAGFAVSFVLLIRTMQLEAWFAGVLWFFAAFFAAGTVAATVQLLPGASELTLNATGFEVVRFFRRQRTDWQDASRFTPVAIPPYDVPLVAYDDANAQTGTSSITGRTATLPDTYGLSADDLASLMGRWRDRAIQESIAYQTRRPSFLRKRDAARTRQERRTRRKRPTAHARFRRPERS